MVGRIVIDPSEVDIRDSFYIDRGYSGYKCKRRMVRAGTKDFYFWGSGPTWIYFFLPEVIKGPEIKQKYSMN